VYKFAGSMPLKNTFFLLGLLLALANAGSALAQTQDNGSRQENTSLSDSNDCTNISVDYQNDPNLTQQEKIELMDKALFHSLNKYESCQNSRSSAGGGGSSGGAQGGGAAGGGSGASTASAEMSGTEPSKSETSAVQQASSASSSEKTDAEALAINEKTDANAKTTRVKGSGKTPDDIPPVDNDSVLEAQIRQAAMNERDPIIKEKLWNEYRKYKGLPVSKP